MSDGGWKVRVRKWGAALTLVAIAAGGIGVSVFILFGNAPARDAAQQTPTPRMTPAPQKLPDPRDFSIGVVVTDRHCPSAERCVYTYTIQPKYIGLQPLTDQPLSVAYQVNGGYEPQFGKFTMQGTQARLMTGVTVDGPAGAQLTAAPTQVLPVLGPTLPNDTTSTLQPSG